MKKVYRSRRHQVIAGICGGIGQYFSVDPNLIRLITLIMFIATGLLPVLITYVVAWFMIPLEENDDGYSRYD